MNPKRNGLLLGGVGGLYSVLCENETLSCRGRGALKRKGVLLAGDRVLLDESGAITEILPRKNRLTRPPVANLDRLFLVVALSDPIPNFYLLDKLTVFCLKNGIEPILVFNKTDLCDEKDVLAAYAKTPFRSVSVCAADGEGVEALRPLFADLISAFSGLSGVGKSSLINRLCPAFRRETGELSDKLNRGKNTTRETLLLPFENGFLADTPGFSELDFDETTRFDRDTLADFFPEFSPFAASCRFRDCRHLAEKDCAVLDAVRAGKIAASRYESYVRMYEELGPWRPWEAEP